MSVRSAALTRWCPAAQVTCAIVQPRPDNWLVAHVVSSGKQSASGASGTRQTLTRSQAAQSGTAPLTFHSLSPSNSLLALYRKQPLLHLPRSCVVRARTSNTVWRRCRSAWPHALCYKKPSDMCTALCSIRAKTYALSRQCAGAWVCLGKHLMPCTLTIWANG